MKKLFILGFTLFFLLSFLLIIKDNNTYAYEDCYNMSVEPKEVTTLSFEKYLMDNNYSEIISFCSFDMCYKVREDNINTSINNFKKMFNKYLSEDEYNELNIKGYPITKIVVNGC